MQRAGESPALNQTRAERFSAESRKTMGLNLADESVDYSDSTELFPFEGEPYGTFDMTLLSFIESGECGSETNKGDKEYDLATCRIDASTNPAFKPGDVYGFFFQTGGDGMTVKSRPYKIKAERSFIAAAFGKSVKDIPIKDYPKKRQELLANVYDGTDKIRLRTKKGNEREDGTFYRDDVWLPA